MTLSTMRLSKNMRISHSVRYPEVYAYLIIQRKVCLTLLTYFLIVFFKSIFAFSLMNENMVFNVCFVLHLAYFFTFILSNNKIRKITKKIAPLNEMVNHLFSVHQVVCDCKKHF
jgi:hypothetical protein